MNKPHFGTYRGWSVERDEWVYGAYHYGEGGASIIDDDSAGHENVSIHVPVFQESLAMFTGVDDSTKKPMYGSFPLPDGTMSKGGDIVSYQERYTCLAEAKKRHDEIVLKIVRGEKIK